MSDKVWKHQLEELKVVMSGWEQRSAITRDIETGASSELRAWFPASDYRKLNAALATFARTQDKRDDQEIDCFVLLPAVPVEPPVMFPIAKLVLKVRHDQLHLGLRLAVFYDLDDEIHVQGWRFESADDAADGQNVRFHHFPHVQRITAWQKASEGLHPPSWTPNSGFRMATHRHVHEVRPAFPLRGETPAGIAVAAMASLYGSDLTLEYLEGSDATCATCRRERAAILCHQPGEVYA